jgi:hypothetical protein
MGLGAPSVATNQKHDPSGPPFSPASANNGLSVDAVSNKIVLGNDQGNVAQPAKLLSNREIPFGTFTLFLTDPFGNQLSIAPNSATMLGAAGEQVLIDATQVLITDSTGNVTSQVTSGTVRIFSDESLGMPSPELILDSNVAGGSFDFSISTTAIPTAVWGNRGTTHVFFFDLVDGRWGFEVPVPTAAVHIKAGVAAASGAPFKYTTGVLAQTVVENGAKNFDGTNESLAVAGVTYTMAKTLTATAVLDFPNTVTLTSSDLTVAVIGAVSGDVVLLGVPTVSVNASSCYTAFVSAADTVTVRFNNYSAAPVNPASGTFRVSIVKY